MNRVLHKQAAKLLSELNSRKLAVECMRAKVSCGESGLESRLKRAETDVEITENAFADLSYKQRDILSAFYVDREPDACERLSQKYCCAKSTVYRMKREAMGEFILRVFGYAE